MMKSYLRYEPKKIFGIISSPQCNAIYDFSGNLAITGGLQNITVWNLRQAQQIASIGPTNPNYPYHNLGTVVSLARSKDRSTLAAGYSTGEVLIFDYITKSVVATLRGHRSAVISLTYDDSGTLLASGGADSDIFIWDMITLSGKYKLRSHKDAVTGIVFVPSAGTTSSQPKYLVSSSKDTLVKVWDMNTQHCIQTIVGHRCEIWSLTLVPLPLQPEGEGVIQSEDYLILTGSSDEMIRGYILHSSIDQVSTNPSVELSDELEVLSYIGSLQSQGGEKCTDLEYHKDSNLLLAISGLSSKNIEMFRLRTTAEVKKKLKRRAKRQREKGDTTESPEAPIDEKPKLEDYFETVANLKSPHKMKSLIFSPIVDRDGSYRILGSTSSNTLEVYKVTVPNQKSLSSPSATQYQLSKLSVLEMHGHRSDVRCVCVSSDGLLIATVSSEGVKLWSTKTYSCVRSCNTGYGVSMCFITGNRYVLVGTKEGKIQIVDSSTGELIVDQDAHEGPVWSVALQPPEGKGFMSGGADKVVKFWDFTVANGTLGIELSRQLMMTHDVMCVGYSPVKKETANRLLVAVGLLDHTVKVFYNDSLKFYLSLYGHKLPVMCLDISHDGNILISGSADKTIKIWGLDFGDCHRSLLAHDDTVTCVKFQPDTHYFFSSSKDGAVKYWDADRFEQILYLPNHISSVWGVAVSPDGSYAVSVGQDRSLRIWERTDDLVFIEEERERALEAKFETEVEKRDQHDASSGEGNLAAALPSIESLKGGERIMEALELAEVEYAKSLQPNYKPSLLLREMTPVQYMSWTLRDSIKSADLEMALLIIPFHLVHRLLFMLLLMSRSNIELEITVRCVVFLIRCHQTRLVSILSLASASSAMITRVGTSEDSDGIDLPALPEIIAELKTNLRHHVDRYRTLLGTNLVTMKYMTRVLENKRSYQDREAWRAVESEAKAEAQKRKISVSDATMMEMNENLKKKKKNKGKKLEKGDVDGV